jgi:hypothetical protein
MKKIQLEQKLILESKSLINTYLTRLKIKLILNYKINYFNNFLIQKGDTIIDLNEMNSYFKIDYYIII